MLIMEFQRELLANQGCFPLSLVRLECPEDLVGQLLKVVLKI